jgi:hypothetical protein
MGNSRLLQELIPKLRRRLLRRQLALLISAQHGVVLQEQLELPPAGKGRPLHRCI